jgi:hypothetical protein
MGPSFDVTCFERQTRLRNDSKPGFGSSHRSITPEPDRGIQMQPDDVPEFEFEFWISGEFKSAAQVWFKIVIGPQLL